MAWLVTREINEYDQDGEYFVAMFKEKPTLEEFTKRVNRFLGPYSKEDYEWWYEGKGRRDRQHVWFWLSEYKLK